MAWQWVSKYVLVPSSTNTKILNRDPSRVAIFISDIVDGYRIWPGENFAFFNTQASLPMWQPITDLLYPGLAGQEWWLLHGLGMDREFVIATAYDKVTKERTENNGEQGIRISRRRR